MIAVTPIRRPCDCENIGDFHRYYRFAWVGWDRHPMGPQPVSVQAAEGNTVLVQDTSRRAHELRWDQAQEELQFGTPDLGMVNSQHTILYLFRPAPRQAHRGYHPNAVNYTAFNGWQLRAVAPNLGPGDYKVLQNLFYPTYFTAEEALGELRRGGRVGCALGRTFGLYSQPGWLYPALAFRRHTIGHLENNTAVIPRLYIDAISTIREKIPGVEVVIK